MIVARQNEQQHAPLGDWVALTTVAIGEEILDHFPHLWVRSIWPIWLLWYHRWRVVHMPTCWMVLSTVMVSVVNFHAFRFHSDFHSGFVAFDKGYSGQWSQCLVMFTSFTPQTRAFRRALHLCRGGCSKRVMVPFIITSSETSTHETIIHVSGFTVRTTFIQTPLICPFSVMASPEIRHHFDLPWVSDWLTNMGGKIFRKSKKIHSLGFLQNRKVFSGRKANRKVFVVPYGRGLGKY